MAMLWGMALAAEEAPRPTWAKQPDTLMVRQQTRTLL
jgi:hypothetical protein